MNRHKKIIVVGGTRPNFIKIAPLIKEFSKHRSRFSVKFIHTGQHYDFLLSEVFFQNLHIPKPDIHLNVGSGSHALQTARIMIEFEKKVQQEDPDLIIVVGDVNSTLACSIVAAKLNIKLAHVEAGLRSFDRTMPEEINRIVTDSLADFLFVSEKSGMANLKREGIEPKKVYFVGNVMIDTLLMNARQINGSTILTKTFRSYIASQRAPHAYSVMTLHRPSNVDSRASLTQVYALVRSICQNVAIVYPVHPRTKKMMKKFGLLKDFSRLKNFIMIKPLGYIDFIKLVKGSQFVLTDSGGLQEETTVLGIPCLTMWENTERPVTVTKGSNTLIGRNKQSIDTMIKKILSGKYKKSTIPEFWDGNTSKRIVDILVREL